MNKFLKKLKKTILSILPWVSYFGILFLTKNIEAIGSIRTLIIGTSGLVYIFYYIIKVRNKPDDKTRKKFKRLFLDLVFLVACFSLWGCIEYFGPFDRDMKDSISAILNFILYLFFIVRMLLFAVPFRFRTLIAMIMGMFIVGGFSSNWWPGIALIFSVIIMLCSEDVLFLFDENNKLEAKQKYSIKKKLFKYKVKLSLVSVAIYISLIFSEISESWTVKFFRWQFKAFKKNPKSHFFEWSISVCVNRVFWFFILALIYMVFRTAILKKGKFFIYGEEGEG
ncbi:hypothetical protein GYN67_07570 [Lactococcus piscium]|uniref:hypothetical protein n=1 Tax=Pseudolactococcus carnosus TaxID=2749961 RepID=UPI001FB98DE3|nr:hypothetical protein [Lactococcus carnosus]MCJ1996546.1 hypothetical protein [Lactococcus carnosus]